MKNMEITTKQANRVNKIINVFGEHAVQSYIRRFYENADINHLSRQEAQKIITGFDHKMPCPVIRGVFGRDYRSVC